MTDSIPDSLIANIEELIKQIQTMNLFDDIFTSVVFKDEGACLHLVRQLMQNPSLNIIDFRTQDDIPMLISKSPRLDITAEDEKGTIYEIEIQRLEEPAPARRVRYYSSVMDSELLRKGVSYDKLPEVYLFYISKEDIWHRGQTLYEVHQSLSIGNESMPYDNGLHTIYVNAEIDDGSDIAKLMQYLKTAKAGDVSQGALSDHVNYLKSHKGGRAKMGEFERYFTEQGEVKERLKRVKALMENAKLGANE
ncbi:MAG: PD-(D/E)XK nuclease family transposase, partial [Phascolarctobacterium sp.]